MQNNNLRLAVPLSFISMLFFPSATWLFFFSQHLNYQQIAGIMGVGALVSLTMEIPTGVFADRVGRKWAVATSYLLFTIAMIGTIFATSYSAFLIVTVINALVNCLYSGSMEALIYDTLVTKKEEKKYDIWVSRMESITWVGLFVSTVMGGYLYTVNPTVPYLAQAVVTFVAFLLALLLVEPKVDTTKYELKEMITNNLSGFRELFANKKIAYLTLVMAVAGLGYYTAADILGISQSKEYGLDPSMVGWVFGVGYLVSAGFSQIYPSLRKRLGEMKLMWMAILALIISFVMAKYVGVILGILLIVMRIASSTTFRNSKSVIINAQIGSKNRATTLSTLTLLSELPYALFAGYLGLYIDRTSPNQFAWVLGLGIILAIILIRSLFSPANFAKLRG